jgi:hypothetical protein
LRFLLQCRTDDQRLATEWQTLLHWLETSLPESLDPPEEDMERSETELFKQHLQQKTLSDKGYAEQLLHTLLEHPSAEKKLLALEQLAYLEHPAIDRSLREWVGSAELHPALQFRVLQILKLRGVGGSLKLHKPQAAVEVELEQTPLSFAEFPPQIHEILHRLQRISEVNEPALFYYAEQTWNEFLAFIYGTPTYAQLAELHEEQVDVWAGALHWILMNTVFATGDEQEIRELYGITAELSFLWEQALVVMKSFARTALINRP